MKGCLLIHGYTGGPFEFDALASYLQKEGYRTLCPTLHGHGGPRKKLRYSSYEKWIESAEGAYLELLKECTDITVIGFSMGGLLTFHLAGKYKPRCIISMSTPIHCIDYKNLKEDLLHSVQTKNMKRLREYFFSCFTPMMANINFQILLHHSKGILPNIEVPTLILQGKKDSVVKSSSAQFIYDHIASSNKEIQFYELSNHLLHYSDERDLIYTDILRFIKQHS